MYVKPRQGHYRLLLKPVSESVLRGTINIASRRFEMLRQNPEQVRRTVVEERAIALPPQRLGLLARIKRVLRVERV